MRGAGSWECWGRQVLPWWIPLHAYILHLACILPARAHTRTPHPRMVPTHSTSTSTSESQLNTKRTPAAISGELPEGHPWQVAVRAP